jgi:IclR family mhp operon transcriptional activator
MPLLECGSGHAYLAHVSDAERHGILAGLEATEKRSHMLEMFKSEKLVRRIREDGYATFDRNPHSAVPGKTSSIGVPIYEGEQVAGTVTLVFFSSAMPMAEAVRRYADDLKAAAAAISQELARDAQGMAQSVALATETDPLPAPPLSPRAKSRRAAARTVTA